MRVVSTRVLPLPAPARISADSSGRVTAARCSGLDAQADRTRSNPFKRTRCRTVFVEAHFIVQCQNDCLSPDETERLPDFLRLCISPPPMRPNPFVCIVRNKKAGSGSPIPTPLLTATWTIDYQWIHVCKENAHSPAADRAQREQALINGTSLTERAHRYRLAADGYSSMQYGVPLRLVWTYINGDSAVPMRHRQRMQFKECVERIARAHIFRIQRAQFFKRWMRFHARPRQIA